MSRVRLRQPAPLLLIALFLGLQIMEPSRAWTILLVAFAGTFISAWLWTWSLGRSIHLRRETRLGWVQVGGRIEERLTLSNTSALPAAFVDFNDQSDLPGFEASRSSSIGAGYFDLWTVSAACDQRGLFSLGGATIQTGDPFGIFDVTITASQRTSILVLPRIAPLPDLVISTSGSQGDGQPRRNALLQTIHATTVREYQHGDGMRQIHWPTTARTNRIFVRLMESAPEGNWWIVLDLDERHMLGEGWDSVEEQSVTLAASLADSGLRERKSVGLLVNGRELAWLPPNPGEGQRWEILQSLAIARPGKTSLTSLLERMGSQLGKHHSLIVITASPKPDWLKSLLPLAKRGLVPTVLLFDPAAFGGEDTAEISSAVFEQHGIRCHVLGHGIIQPPPAGPAESVQWTWRSTPTGEIVPVRK